MIKFIAGTINLGLAVTVTWVYAVHADGVRMEQRLKSIATEDRACLQEAVYWEARNQSTLGKVAVAWVILNRMESSRYPDSICGVAHQGKKHADGSMKRHKCQFSYYCDGKSDVPANNVVEQRAWEDAELISSVALIDWAKNEPSPVEDATMYHADYADPYWTDSYTRVTSIDTHIFYN